MSTKRWWEDGYNEKEHAKDLASVGQASQEQIQMLEKEEEQDSTQYPRIQQQQQQHKVFKLEEQKDALAQKIINTMDVKSDNCRMKLEAIRDFIDIILRSENK